MKLDILPYNKPTLAQKMLQDHGPPVRWWRVETEGDVEGRSIVSLGVHYGHIAEIAFMLADKSYYVLDFKVSPLTVFSPRKSDIQATAESVNIRVGPIPYSISSLEIWMDAIESVKVEKSNYYQSFKLTLK